MVQAEAVSDLLGEAAHGDRRAWNRLVERFIPLVYSIIRRYTVQKSDAEDISQTVWLRLLEHLDSIREPDALPGWLTTTTRNETLRLLRARQRTLPIDPGAEFLIGQDFGEAPADDLLVAERRQALREGLAELSLPVRRLLLLLATDPPTTYEEISRTLNMPIGSIGPTRARYLKKLRATASLRALMGSDEEDLS